MLALSLYRQSTCSGQLLEELWMGVCMLEQTGKVASIVWGHTQCWYDTGYPCCGSNSPNPWVILV